MDKKQNRKDRKKLHSMMPSEGLNLMESNSDIILYPKSITLISLFPIHLALRDILSEIYKITQTIDLEFNIPMEHHIAQIVDQIINAVVFCRLARFGIANDDRRTKYRDGKRSL